MTATLRNLFMIALAAAFLLSACDESDDGENPANGNTDNPTFDWIKSFEFAEDYGTESDGVFIFEGDERYDQLPVYLFNALLLNSYEEPTLTDRLAVFNDDGTFAVQRNWDMGDAAVYYSDRQGIIDITGKFGSGETFEYIIFEFSYDAGVSGSEIEGELTESFAVQMNGVPYEKIGDEVHIDINSASDLQTMISEIEYDSTVPIVEGVHERKLSSVDWDLAKTVGLHFRVVLSTRTDG